MVQQRFQIGDRDIPQPFISTLHMVIMAGQSIGAFPVDGWGPLQTLEFTRLLDELSEVNEREEMHLRWPEN